MPKSNRPPAYRLHKARQSAVVTIDGKNFYLGVYGSLESREKYARLIAEHAAAPSLASIVEAVNPTRTVADVLLAYLDFAKTYYVNSEGKPSNQYGCCRNAAQVVLDLYGSLSANEFGPLKLQAARQAMIEKSTPRKKTVRRPSR